jgi:hypothetical protein
MSWSNRSDNMSPNERAATVGLTSRYGRDWESRVSIEIVRSGLAMQKSLPKYFFLSCVWGTSSPILDERMWLVRALAHLWQ